jgi:hypothetical protein
MVLEDGDDNSMDPIPSHYHVKAGVEAFLGGLTLPPNGSTPRYR